MLHRLDELPSNRVPQVILATQSTLAAGPARALLQEFAANPRNLVLWPYLPPVRECCHEACICPGQD